MTRSETPTSANPPSQEEYLQFLMKILRATRDSQGDPEVVYPLLAANQDKLDDNFIAVLQGWAKATLPEMEASQAEGIAIDIGTFATLIGECPAGNKAANIEISLTSYEISLTVFTRHSHPETWAAIQNNLGNAYGHRIKGDIAENLELAIAAYQNALSVYTKEAFPNDWAGIQHNLGNAYRIKGDKAENLELAIAAYKNALSVYTKALQTAQQFLRQLTGKAFKKKYAKELKKALDESMKQAYQNLQAAKKQHDSYPQDSQEYRQWQEKSAKYQKISDRIGRTIHNLNHKSKEEHPFAHPVYWSGFICAGLRD